MREDRRARVLFVCLGNICRSPTGEGVFQYLVNERGLQDAVQVDSAGTIGYHTGKPADARMREAAARRGYDLTSRARQATADDLESHDLVVAMDRSNYDDLVAMHPQRAERVRMLGSFLPEASEADPALGAEVPDPYYGGPGGFETVLDMIERACPGILAWLMPDAT